MAVKYEQVRRDVLFFLASLRQSVDRPFRMKLPDDEAERERFMRTILLIEGARVRFSTFTRYRDVLTQNDWLRARSELRAFIADFMGAGWIGPDVYQRRFRTAPLMNRDRESASEFMSQFLTDKAITVGDALSSFNVFLDNAVTDLTEVAPTLAFSDLAHIVPRQQVAPVQFGIEKGRIVVIPNAPKTLEADRKNAASALEHIKDSGKELIQNLERSNCDPRLLTSVKELQLQLFSDANIVKVGLTNLACGIMGAQFQAELPNAIAAMFNSYNMSVSLYVAQFPEWEQFTQKAAAADIDDEDIAEVDQAAVETIAALESHPELADPEVPKTIAFVRRFLSQPGPSAKRAGFALIRTLENLVSSILLHTVTFIEKTAEKTVEACSTVTSKIIAGLLGIALLSATGIGPAAVRTGAPWVKQVADVVQKQIEKLSE